MVDMAMFVACAGLWSALRFVRCGTCGVPLGIAEALVRIVSDECSACSRTGARRDEASVAPRFASTPELQSRGDEIRRQLTEMVERQLADLRAARDALAAPGSGRSVSVMNRPTDHARAAHAVVHGGGRRT